MAYEKHNWVNGEVITDEKLNHMEDGIASSSSGEATVFSGISTEKPVNVPINTVFIEIDSGDICYLKRGPIDPATAIIMQETTLDNWTKTGSYYYFNGTVDFSFMEEFFAVGKKVVVVWDDVNYECEVKLTSEGYPRSYYVGAPHEGGSIDFTNYPFQLSIQTNLNNATVYSQNNNSHVMQLSEVSDSIWAKIGDETVEYILNPIELGVGVAELTFPNTVLPTYPDPINNFFLNIEDKSTGTKVTELWYWGGYGYYGAKGTYASLEASGNNYTLTIFTMSDDEESPFDSGTCDLVVSMYKK